MKNLQDMLSPTLRSVALLSLAVGLMAAPGATQEIEFRPMEPDPINSPMMRPMQPRLEIPATKVLPLETAPTAPPRAGGGFGQFVVVNRDLGRLVVRRGQEIRTFKQGPLSPPLPPELRAGQKVEVRFSAGDLIQSVRILP